MLMFSDDNEGDVQSEMNDNDFPKADLLNYHLSKINAKARVNDQLSWDIRLKLRSHTSNGKKSLHQTYMIEFGTYFKYNYSQYRTIFVGGGQENEENILIAIFDAEHPQTRLHESNTKIFYTPNQDRMSHLFSEAIFKEIINFFNLRITRNKEDRSTFHFKIAPLKNASKVGQEFKCKILHMNEDNFTNQK